MANVKQIEAARRSVELIVREPVAEFVWKVNCSDEQLREIESLFRDWANRVIRSMDGASDAWRFDDRKITRPRKPTPPAPPPKK